SSRLRSTERRASGSNRSARAPRSRTSPRPRTVRAIQGRRGWWRARSSAGRAAPARAAATSPPATARRERAGGAPLRGGAAATWTAPGASGVPVSDDVGTRQVLEAVAGDEHIVLDADAAVRQEHVDEVPVEEPGVPPAAVRVEQHRDEVEPRFDG